MVGGAKRREHVWRADGGLLQDLRSLAGRPAKILNSELLAIRRLQNCAPGFVLVAMLRARLGVRRRPHRGVETGASTSIVGNRGNAAWFFRHRVGTGAPFRSARPGAIRSKPVKKDPRARATTVSVTIKRGSHDTDSKPAVAGNDRSGDPVSAPACSPQRSKELQALFARRGKPKLLLAAGAQTKVTYNNIFYVPLTCALVGKADVSVRGRLIGFGP